ncbi:MAG: cytoplasmic protein [Betaproteobacteria bacterium]|jgi:hypothetical protein
MNPAVVIAGLFLLAAGVGHAADPLDTDADKYKLRIENERVRVLEYHDKPGDKTNMHEHPDFVLYALSSFKRKLTFPDGKSMNREFKAGDVIFMKGQTHIGENIGDSDTDVVIVELKQPAR